MDNSDGQITTHSVSAGLDYPGVGPEHAYLSDIGRANYVGATDEEALEAFHEVSQVEGIIPALETAHLLRTHLRPQCVRIRRSFVICPAEGTKIYLP